jgi:polyphosphate kinase
MSKNKEEKASEHDSEEVNQPAGQADVTPGKMKRKEFERELEKLQIELVKLQRWVVHEG